MFLLHASTDDLRRGVPVVQAFAFWSGGLCRRSGRSKALHCLRPPMFRFGRPIHPQPCVFRLRDAIFSSWGHHIFSSLQASLPLSILFTMHIRHHAPHCTIFHHPWALLLNLSSTVLRFCRASDTAVYVVLSSLLTPSSSRLPYILPLSVSFCISSGRRSTSSNSVFYFPLSLMPSSSYMPPFFGPKSLLYALRKSGGAISVDVRNFPFSKNILRMQL